MCGPIATMVPGAKGKKRWLSILLYHGGKISAYVLIGSFFGLFSVFLTSLKVQAIISIVGGLIIAGLALAPAVLNYVERKGFTVMNGLIQLKNRLAKSMQQERMDYGIYIGFLNGFIPCGLVYIAALGAMVQPTMIESIVYMVLFGLGTAPFLSLIILSSSFLKERFAVQANRFRMIAMLLVAGFMIWKGYQSIDKQFDQAQEGDDFTVCEVIH